jgi:UDP-N-acetylmuramyl-tripeptide synthetase
VRLAQILEHIGEHRVTGDAGVEVRSVTADSRAVKKDALFAAINGCSCDGHEFVSDAVSRGAAVLLVQRPMDADVPQVIVPDTRIALARAADAFFGKPSDALKVVGITGTNGKTTTAYLLRAILEHAGVRTGLLGTIEYITGGKAAPAGTTTPDAVTLHGALAKMVRFGDEAAVMEVSSHALDQERAAAVRFDAAVFTNLSGDHLDYHRDMDAYCAAKAKFFSSLGADAKVILNADDDASHEMARAAKCPVLWYGIEKDADFSARVESETLRGTGVSARLRGEGVRFTLPLPGRFNVRNALAAAASASVLGVETAVIARALGDFAGVPGRLQRVDAPAPFTVFVDYAHTDDALINVLQAVRPLAKGRLIAVFGCGGDRDRTKRPRMAAAAEKFADLAVLTSDNPRTEDPDAIIADAEKGFSKNARYMKVTGRADGIRAAIGEAGEGDVVVIAGKGHEDYQILADRTIHFDDREVAREIMMEAAR